MPENIDEQLGFLQEILQNQNAEESLEQFLIKLILGQDQVTWQRVRIDDNLPDGVLFDLRQGTNINQAGILETHEELIINAKSFNDGNPMNTYGLIKCQTCGAVVYEDNIRRCFSCFKTCCISPGCGHFSRYSLSRQFIDGWYCSSWHSFLGFFGIHVR